MSQKNPAAEKKQPTLKAFDMLIADLTSQRESLHHRLANANSTIEANEATMVELRAIIGAKDAEIEKLNKELKSAENMRDHHRGQSEKHEARVNSIHALLDGLPNTGERTMEVKKSYGCSTEEVCPVTRLGMFLGHMVVAK